MNEHLRQKGSIFLIEILVNMLIFSVLLIICLQLIMKAHHMTFKTTALYQAVDVADNIANIYESKDGSIRFIGEVYRLDESDMKNKLTIYFDKNFNKTSNTKTSYYADVELISEGKNLSKIAITVFANNEEVYSTQACHFSKRGGAYE